jgi:hypothetical protein
MWMRDLDKVSLCEVVIEREAFRGAKMSSFSAIGRYRPRDRVIGLIQPRFIKEQRWRALLS